MGFSYAHAGETVVYFTIRVFNPASLTAEKETTEAAAKDIAAFLAIFFESMDGLKGRPFHMAGESYGVMK